MVGVVLEKEVRQSGGGSQSRKKGKACFSMAPDLSGLLKPAWQSVPPATKKGLLSE